jgi:hypothetical protein
MIQSAPGLTIDRIVVSEREEAHTPNGISLYARWPLSRYWSWPLRDWRYVAQHHPEMAGTSCHDEEVPQLVETEDSGHQVWTL